MVPIKNESELTVLASAANAASITTNTANNLADTAAEILADQMARKQALDPARSFVVSAPAGSGKTELLTQRVLRLLTTVTQPEQILCMTFTRKAAGEMQSRILAALAKAAELPPIKEPRSHHDTTIFLAQKALAQDRHHNWKLLSNPNRLRILTIDGFCLYLAQQLAVESQFGTYSEPLEDPTPLYKAAIASLLLPTLEKKSAVGLAIGTLLSHLDNDLNKLEQLLVKLLSKREQWLTPLLESHGERHKLERFLHEVITETLSDALDLLTPYGSDLSILLDYAASQLPEEKRDSAIYAWLGTSALPSTTPENLPQWLGLCELLLTGRNEWRKRLDKNVGFPTVTSDGDKTKAKTQKAAMANLATNIQDIPSLLELLKDIRYLPSVEYSDQQWAVLNALALLLPSLSAQLSVFFQQQKVCDFTEITLAALRALGLEEQPTDLALKLDYQIQHILTDEFQDTSSIQFKLLKQLTAGWYPDDGRSLFIVGDAMQSLYSFRNANVGLFLEARYRPLGNIQLEPLDLRLNFRSQATIIHWVNQSFTDIFPTRDNISRGAVSYSPAIPDHPATGTETITVDGFIGSFAAQAEAEHVAHLVTQVRQQSSDHSIAILVRNRTHLPTILQALHRAGHHWQAADIDPLGNRMPVIDLMSLTRALLSPADRIAWLALLRSPWCGLDLPDLYQVANAQIGENNLLPYGEHYPLLLLNILYYKEIEHLSVEGKAILSRISPVLKQGWEQRFRKPLRTWIEGLWIALGGLAALPSVTEHKQCLQYFNLLEQHEFCGSLDSWLGFEKAVKTLYAAPDHNADPNLQVMTIHKAKGLEFDTVIIPCLNKKPRNDDKQLLLWQERVGKVDSNQLIIGPLEGAGQHSDPIFSYLQREQTLKNQLEKARVLYVGATRAVKTLHFSYTMTTPTAPISNSLLESLWPAIEKDIHHQERSIATIRLHNLEDGSEIITDNHDATIQYLPVIEPVLNTLSRLPSYWQPPKLNIKNDNTPDSQSNWFQTKPKTLQENIAACNLISRHTGTVMHRILRQIVLEGLNQWDINSIESRKLFWEIQLKTLGVTAIDGALNNALGLLQRGISNCLKDETGRWLLSHQHLDSRCEFALGYTALTGEARTVVIDRCFMADNTHWIIDYKLAEPSDKESLTHFVAREVQQYREQLCHYAELYQQWLMTRQHDDKGKPKVKTALYFPLIMHLEIVK